MIKIYHFGPHWGMLDASPFCCKLITYARLARLEHELAPGLKHIANAPKGKMPYIEHNGKIIGDSCLVIDYLKQQFGDPLNEGLNPQQKAITHAVGKMLDENFYWLVVYTRWGDLENFNTLTRPELFGGLSAVKRAIGPPVIRKKTLKAMHGHGIGRHSESEMMAIGCKDLQAIESLLDDKPFIFGDEPKEIDVFAYAFLDSILKPPHRSPLKDFIASTLYLVDYHHRMDQLVMMEPM